MPFKTYLGDIRSRKPLPCDERYDSVWARLVAIDTDVLTGSRVGGWLSGMYGRALICGGWWL